MAQVINTNIASLNAQRNLNSSQSALSTSLERLSSGMRINSDSSLTLISAWYLIPGCPELAPDINDRASTALGHSGISTFNSLL